MRTEESVRERYEDYMSVINNCSVGCAKKHPNLYCWACELANQHIHVLRWILEIDLEEDPNEER